MRFTTPFLIGALLVSASACGSDDPKQAATATEGDAFCTAAKSADTTGDAVDFENGTSETLKVQVKAALEAATSALALAPADIEDTAQEVLGFQQRFADLLETHDYDIVAAGESEEGRALFNDPAPTAANQDLDAYLEEKCGIVSS